MTTQPIISLKVLPSLSLNIVSTPPVLSLNIVPVISSPHMCYILKALTKKKPYIGYTVDFPHRLRQHNGEIIGGAKKTVKGRPWSPICLIKGFYDQSSALRFEYRLQHPKPRKKPHEDSIIFILQVLTNLISSGDGSVAKGNKTPWPTLHIYWYYREYSIQHSHVVNHYL